MSFSLVAHCIRRGVTVSTMALGQTSAWHESARGKDRENEELRFGSLWGVVTFSGIQAMLHDYRMYLENMYSMYKYKPTARFGLWRNQGRLGLHQDFGRSQRDVHGCLICEIYHKMILISNIINESFFLRL